MALDASPPFTAGRLAWRLQSPLVVMAVGAFVAIGLMSWEVSTLSAPLVLRTDEPIVVPPTILVRPYRQAAWYVAGGTLAASLALAGLRLWQVVRPLSAVDATLAAVAGGAIARRVEIEAAGEMGHLIEQVNRTLDHCARRAVRWEAAHAGAVNERQEHATARQRLAELLTELARETSSLAASRDLPDRLHDLAVVAGGELSLRPRRFCPRDLLRDVCQELAPLAAAKQLAIHVQWNGRVPASVFNDPAPLRRAVATLLRHGLQRTTQGGVLVEAEMKSNQGGLPYLQVEVVDNGEPLSKAELAAQLDLSTSADAAERGGTRRECAPLTLCRRIAVLLGGDMQAAHSTDLGCCWRLTIAAGPMDGVSTHAAVGPQSFGVPLELQPRDALPPIPMLGAMEANRGGSFAAGRASAGMLAAAV